MKTKYIKLFILGCLLPFGWTNLTSCNNDDENIQLANYESYMSNVVQDRLRTKYNIQFPYYTVAELIESKFEKFYDIAIPCGYELISLLRRGWLETIDWKKFNIPGINNSDDALNSNQLFQNKGIKKINQQITNYLIDLPESDPIFTYLKNDKTFKDNTFNILDYGIPYFEQSFSFAYKGEEINFYDAKTKNKINKETLPTWNDVFYTISPSNPNLDERFNPKDNHRIAMVDDGNTIYDVARIIETNGETNQIPSNDTSLTRMKKTFGSITDKFSNKSTSWFYLNSDSGLIAWSLANPNGSIAALSWTGDLIYAAQGVEEFDIYDSSKYHIQKVRNGSLNEIDFMVINNKNHKNLERLNNIYSVIYEITLSGYDKQPNEIIQMNEQGEYKYSPTENFNATYYTPMLKNLYDAVTSNQNQMFWLEQGYEQDSIDIFINALQAITDENDTYLYGRTKTPLENSNIHFAWLEARSNL